MSARVQKCALRSQETLRDARPPARARTIRLASAAGAHARRRGELDAHNSERSKGARCEFQTFMRQSRLRPQPSVSVAATRHDWTPSEARARSM